MSYGLVQETGMQETCIQVEYTLHNHPGFSYEKHVIWRLSSTYSKSTLSEQWQNIIKLTKIDVKMLAVLISLYYRLWKIIFYT